MKHLLALIFLVTCLYIVWNTSSKKTRRLVVRFITKHGIRLGLLIAILFLMVGAAVYFPSSSII